MTSLETRPLIGGQLARPHDRWPKEFADDFWIRYPYFLPCAVSASCSAFAFLIAALFMKEVSKYPPYPSTSSHQHRPSNARRPAHLRQKTQQSTPRKAPSPSARSSPTPASCSPSRTTARSACSTSPTAPCSRSSSRRRAPSVGSASRQRQSGSS